MNVEQNLIERFRYGIAAIIILISASIIAINFPAENQYYTGADEGNYFRQGKLLADNGFSGFNLITKEYINKVSLQDAPNPFRVGANVLTAMALGINESYHSITTVCLLCFVFFLIGTFYFIEKFWGGSIALLSLLLLSFSPLEMAMARRALMDMPAMMALAFSCYAFWFWINSKNTGHLFTFILWTIASILLKEVNILFMLFFAAAIIYVGRENKSAVSFSHAWCALLIPPASVGIIYLSIFGLDDGLTLFKTMHRAVSTSAYSAQYGQGPWYRIFIDYLMLSPLVVILAIGYGWHVATGQDFDRNIKFILILSIFMVAVFSFLPKNVRYAIFFDVPLRILAANALFILTGKWYKRNPNWNVIAILFLVLVFMDVHSFFGYFIDSNIYDPVSYNLLKATGIIPSR